jgi:hypothetical protein
MLKSGSGFQKLSLDENIDRAVERSAELLALDDALKALAEFDEQKRGWSNCATSAASPSKRQLTFLASPHDDQTSLAFAKAWLHGEMQKN